MQDTDLFLSLAEIAGVFVGFGALIAVRSSSAMEGSEINVVRWVVTTGIWVVIVALAPIIVSGYGLSGHELWLVCSLLALALFAVMITVSALAPENLADLAATRAATPRATRVVVYGPTIWLPVVLLVLALALVILGLLADHERVLYVTAVALGLLMGALGLFVGVFWQRRPSVAADRGGLPASGDSSA